MIGAMRTTLDLDDDVLQAIKELGTLKRKTAGQILSELARQALAPASQSPGRVRNGVPLLPSIPRPPHHDMADVNRLRDAVSRPALLDVNCAHCAVQRNFTSITSRA